MPPGKRPQTDPLLYALIVFVGLFIVATTVAVIYYVKFEEQRKNAIESENKLNQMVLPAEQRKGIGKIVGTIPSGQSALGTTVGYLDSAISLITGTPVEDTSAEVKLDTTAKRVRETLNLVSKAGPNDPNIRPSDPNIGLIRTVEQLKRGLDDTNDALLALNKQFRQRTQDYQNAMNASYEKEQELLAEKEKLQQQVNAIKQDYNDLQKLLETTSEQRVEGLLAQVEQERQRYNDEHGESLKLQAQLRMAEDRIDSLQQEIQNIMPAPDSNVAVHKSDGRILLIDDQAKVVHISIGSEHRVYPGLTFAVYDKRLPIPGDGKGKAEIEVFDVQKKLSAARIIRSKIKDPIVVDDMVVNLIWESDRSNLLVVAGEFDLDSDGVVERDAGDKIEILIQKWGGRTTEEVLPNTDFIILGQAPQVLPKPTSSQVEIDPLAQEKYQASVQRLADYTKIQRQAESLSIPILSYERFLYFIGYKTQSGRAGAFE